LLLFPFVVGSAVARPLLPAEKEARYRTQSSARRIPTFCPGATFNLTFKSKIDGSIQPLLVSLPRVYTPEKSWPLLVTLHGLGDGPILANDIDSMVQIGPCGRGSVWFTGIGKRDVFEAIEMAKRLFSIDPDRICLSGFSMGAVATFNLGLDYPDLWAACVPVCGECPDLSAIENARHLPFWINTGQKDLMMPPLASSIAYQKALKLGLSHWRYTEYRDMDHSFAIDWKRVQEWLLTKKRTTDPKQVCFCTKNLKSNRAYWVRLTELEQYGKPGRIHAVIDGQKITVKTDNISNYTLTLNNRLLDLTREVEILENDIRVFSGRLTSDGHFAKNKTSPHMLLKRPGLSGPLWDIYSSQSLLVYGTHSNTKDLTDAAERCAHAFANPGWMNEVSFRIVPDTAVTKKDLADNNLVLFGTTRTNKLLAQISEKLPVRMTENRILAQAGEYADPNYGYVLIYPNPLNREKYVAVFAGTTAETIDCFHRIWPGLNSTPHNIDFGIFQLTPNPNLVNWRLKGIFNSNWNWQ
jgi:predicted esterase